MYVKNDGRILYFCSSKCDRNTEMGRVPKRKKWTKFFEKEVASKDKPAKSEKKEKK
jgi:large subunit ribosomal protein L24e